MGETLRLVAVFPHPDDESLGLGGTLAKYAAENVETYVVCATRGERGWTGVAEENPGLEALGRIREAELRCAASRLGVSELTFLDYIDGDVDQAHPQEIISRIAAHVRRIQPHVVVTFPPDGHYGHPDHIALSQFTGAALVCAADATFRDPDNLAPFSVLKFYYMIDTATLVESIRRVIGPISIVVDGIERNHVGWEAWAVTTRIDTRPYFETVWQAILCHQSQLPGYGPLVELPQEMLLSLWGEGTFYRVFSLVNGGRTVERDLFEGLGPR
jgi:LmbE family N-acetylglucosaminyl deacetylase